VTADTQPAARDGGGDDADRVPSAMLEDVVEPQDLTPQEKETTIRFGKVDDQARVHTDERGLTARVLAHPEAVVLAVHVDDDGRTRTVTPREWGGRRVVGVEATLPVAAITVRQSPRRNPQHGDAVTERVFEAGRNARLAGGEADE